MWLSDLELVGTTSEHDGVVSIGGLAVPWAGPPVIPVYVRRFDDRGLGEIFLSVEDVGRRRRWPEFLSSSHQLAPVEQVGLADCPRDTLMIGNLAVPWPRRREVECVYVRRSLRDLSVAQIRLARHDGLADELLIARVQEAERYPLGPAAYWCST